jgi:hypothetical protein
VKIGAKVAHGRELIFQIAEGAVFHSPSGASSIGRLSRRRSGYDG